MSRPAFSHAWRAFQAVLLPVASVGKLIGGKVQQNIDLPVGGFKNACPIRISYVLNKTGYPIAKSARYAMVSGADRQQYIFRVNDMMDYLAHTFGKPDKTVATPKPSDFSGQQGIIVIKGHGWDNAQGHVTLWDGSKCPDSCHLLHDPDNGAFIPETGSLWLLR